MNVSLAQDSILECDGLAVSFRVEGTRLEALGPVDLAVRRGEFVSLVGPSGCGKSTILRVMAGLAHPTEGTLRIALNEAKPGAIATVFQDYGILPWKSTLENVELGLRAAGVGRRESRKRAMHWLHRMGLKGFEDSYPHQLSGGMRQRVGIARSFAVEPELLLLDEPFAALDAQMREIMQQELLDLCADGSRTVVLITHSLDEALVLGDRVLVMSARPGTFVEDLAIDFKSAKSEETRKSPEFVEARDNLWTSLKAQVLVGEGEES